MKKCVAVLYGGRSGEHEISIRSARAILDAIDRSRYDVTGLFITPDGAWRPGPILPAPGANPGIDVVFPALHGTFGEDGTIQGLLELAGLPYVGSGVAASAAAMDKDLTKRICRERGVPVVDWLAFPRDGLDADAACRALPFPMFVKPANLGSSVGISKADDRAELEAAMNLAAGYDRKIIVERAITGRELECAVLGNDHPEASAPCEILPSREFYDYEDKYLTDGAELIAPAVLTPAVRARLQELAVAAFAALGGSGMARVDFLLEGETPYVNELNTLPGFTSISMYPRLWALSGVPLAELVDRLVTHAFERHADRRRLDDGIKEFLAALAGEKARR
jgi:D-alanine-D-alanine ligase